MLFLYQNSDMNERQVRILSVTVEVIKDYKDKEKSLLYHPKERFETSEKRSKELVEAGVVKVVTKKEEKEI